MSGDELDAIAQRYARRADGDRYSLLRPEVLQAVQERQRAMLRRIATSGDPARLQLMELGCGDGGNLLELLRAGFEPGHLGGVELLPGRLDRARARLPAATWLWQGDARQAPVADGSQDLVLMATVLSSVLDDAVQHELADAAWRWLRPGGALLCYDFAVDNPRNRDVRGVPVARLGALFPGRSAMQVQRLTLVPPLARQLARVHPALITMFNLLPWLRTHRLAWIVKPA